MSDLGHLMILASAGAGKTYALTTRFVRLLALGAPPERIVALTFTRKAAGEFFDEILNRLAAAATEAKAARTLAREIEQGDFGTEDFLGLLRAMINAMSRLHLGTLDGFFSRLVQAFPLELGLGGEFTLLEEATARRERQRVLGLIFGVGATSEAARDDFLEAFKRATYGVEEKGLQRRLDRFLDEHGETYLAAPNGDAWGNPARIWPEGCPWLDESEPIAAAAERCREALPWAEFNEKQRARWEDFFTALQEWVPGAVLPKPVEYLLKNALAVWDGLWAGDAVMTIERRKVSLDPATGRAIAGVMRAIVAAEFTRKFEITRGIHAVLALYDRVYDDQVRRTGQLTFADVQRLLQPDGPGAMDAERRLLIDWRLDARFDHWLLDEFQDTSRRQWAILRNLIDEAVQDPEGRRSFFYVGDVKQAIYAWRGGDARLFREIFDYYNEAAPGSIGEQHLTQSWRSGPAVIAMVNAVCGEADALSAMVPPVVVERWIRDWRAHESARPQLAGFAALRQADDEAGRFAETLRILGDIDPAERGLTVAVLVQKNDTGARLAEYLRAEGGLAAIAESDLHIAFDNPFTCGLLALLRWAAYPADSMAREAVAMSPVARVLDELGWRDPSQVCTEVLAEIDAAGFAGMLFDWVRRMEPHIAADDHFSRLRGRQLIEAAEAFDENGGRDVAEFLDWMAAHTLREAEAPGVIRVMTVHKAKGLGFDVVVLPDLQGQSVDQRRKGLAVHRDAHHEVDWVLDLPTMQLAQNDSVFAEQIDAEKAESAYEALCKLYVALTRAKQALYVVMEPVGRSSSRNFPKLLTQALGETWQAGDPDWFRDLSTPEADVAVADESSRIEPPEQIERMVRRSPRTPAGGATVFLPGERWFAAKSSSRAAWGTTVHELLGTIEWLTAEELGDWVERMITAGRDAEAVRAVAELWKSAETRALFERPSTGETDVWRERAYEWADGATWTSGVFDRVVVERDDRGMARSLKVYDFKTDEVGQGSLDAQAEGYRPQLTQYAEAAARLAQVALSQVTVAVVFVRAGRVVELR
ncbi:UvrD-helicase domain-containing protein [Synoicihabitans lomoniglobus]|uniref:DNA 3'-5' helicase n=1 Tax=Synoicihabitans lomoniglobus TaxID=2909285 RepID=A0AAE9ZXP2_9BACT|nr:UvrD-helicase domain-containing protein [Opitutaceae bacterium LMO-M01]WED65456.1 UvrD-helicase domain-containing protein [Opitutaceae bacterium LMO-M01]